MTDRVENSSDAAGGPVNELFAREFEAAAPALLAWAQLSVRPQLRTLLDPEDLIQEVGCRALARIHTYDPTRASFRQWLFGFGNHVLLEALRELGRKPLNQGAHDPERTGWTDAVAQVTTITRKVARNELVRLFLRRVDQLDADDRALLLHHGIEDLPHPQVATLLGIAEHAVRKRWQRLCERLRTDPVFAALALE